MRNWFSKRVNIVFSVWILLTLVILVNNSLFSINEFIAHPQHGHFDNFQDVTDIIIKNGKLGYYRAFFILDGLWAFSLLYLIWLVIDDLHQDVLFSFLKRHYSVFSFFVAFAILAYALDLIEGYQYLTYNITDLLLVVELKVIFYALCMLSFVYWLLKKYLIPNLRDIIRFVETSFLSLLFISLVYVLITLMPQGGTLIVEMLYSGWNILIFFGLLTFLTIIISHYPVYIDIWRYGNNNCVKLGMPERSFNFLGLNIIYYYPASTNDAEDARYNRSLVKKMRRSLGILLYVAIFNIFLGVGSRFYEVDLNADLIALLILVITLLVYNYFGKRYDQWKATLSVDASEETIKATVKTIIKYVGFFPWYFVISTLLVILTAIVAEFTHWNRWTLMLCLITLGFQMFLYVYFKICRTYFKYVFFNEKLYKKKPQMFRKSTLELFKTHAPENHNKKKNYIQRLSARLSDNERYLELMRGAGLFALACLVLANFSFTVATFFNPITIILLYIILFYSVVTITFKHVLYYHRLRKAVRYRKLYRYGVPSLIIILILVTSYLASIPNDLHQLQMVKQEKPMMGYEKYMDQLLATSDSLNNNYFFIGSYGGGLKANLWNLLLFQKLDSITNQRFLDRTIVLSGVSGGAVGIGNYSSLSMNATPDRNESQCIDEIGKSNVLSNELTLLFGKDWLREYMPFLNNKGRDRSYESMKLHAKLTGMKDGLYNKVAYSDYWQDIYKSSDRKYPILIMNTTSVDGLQGVASTVRMPEHAFPGADRINIFFRRDQDSLIQLDSTLTYFGTVSTTNRFPLFSPTAKIKDKGSYLDGGYFENSGLLSAMEAYDALAGDPEKPYHGKINPIFINIINSKDYYIRQQLNDWGFQKVDLSDGGELGSIIGTVASIDKLPNYVSAKINARGFALENIMMPHKITYAEVQAILKSKVDDPIRLMQKIEENNMYIDRALDEYENYLLQEWGVVQPPLARLLSEPAVEYQKAMINKHKLLQAALQRIDSIYLNTTKTIDVLEQQQIIQKQIKQQTGQKGEKLLRTLPDSVRNLKVKYLELKPKS